MSNDHNNVTYFPLKDGLRWVCAYRSFTNFAGSGYVYHRNENGKVERFWSLTNAKARCDELNEGERRVERIRRAYVPGPISKPVREYVPGPKPVHEESRHDDLATGAVLGAIFSGHHSNDEPKSDPWSGGGGLSGGGGASASWDSSPSSGGADFSDVSSSVSSTESFSSGSND